MAFHQKIFRTPKNHTQKLTYFHAHFRLSLEMCVGDARQSWEDHAEACLGDVPRGRGHQIPLGKSLFSVWDTNASQLPSIMVHT